MITVAQETRDYENVVFWGRVCLQRLESFVKLGDVDFQILRKGVNEE